MPSDTVSKGGWTQNNQPTNQVSETSEDKIFNVW